MNPRERNGLRAGIMICYVPVRPRQSYWNWFCENPLTYRRCARVETHGNHQFYVASPANCLGLFTGPWIVATRYFRGESIRAVICGSCYNLIGFMRRGEYYLLASMVHTSVEGDVESDDSDHSSDSGNN